jgi:gliding motility-associated protein GldE
LEDSVSQLFIFLNSTLAYLPITQLLNVIIIIVLLILSAFASGCEVAFFSLSNTDLEEIEDRKPKAYEFIRNLLDEPKKLLATILVLNNMVNLALIIISTIFIEPFIQNIESELVRFLITVVAITFLLVLFGEVIPKVYATKYKIVLSEAGAVPMFFMAKLFSPISAILEGMVKNIDAKFQKKQSNNVSIDDLSEALALTAHEPVTENEKKILKGIIEFGDKEVKEIMKPRMDVVAFEFETNYHELLKLINEAGFSRVPIQKESFDEIVGILYIKDVLPHLQQNSAFEWQSLIRPALFVPENMKLDDLLKSFQERKIHMAVVVDEYGGSLGICTLEDIIEEIVGDIKDEFDDEEDTHNKLDDNNYVFEGKTSLNDVFKIMEIDGEEFEEVRGEADTLAGFILELVGYIPQKNQKIHFQNYLFTIEAADKRKIKKVKVSLKNNQQ